MSLPFLKNFSPIVNLIPPKSFPSSSFRKMPTTRFSSAKREINPSTESKNPGDDSVQKVIVFVRKKRAKKTVQAIAEVKPEVVDQKPSSLPEIEDFAFGKQNSYSRSNEVLPPADWEKVLEGIRKMRSSEDAPVDSMGYEKAGISLPPKELFSGFFKTICLQQKPLIKLMK